MIAIKITTQLVNFVMDRLNCDTDEAVEFAHEFVGMLYVNYSRLQDGSLSLDRECLTYKTVSLCRDIDHFCPGYPPVCLVWPLGLLTKGASVPRPTIALDAILHHRPAKLDRDIIPETEIKGHSGGIASVEETAEDQAGREGRDNPASVQARWG